MVRLDRAAGLGQPTRLDEGDAARAFKASGLQHRGIDRALDLGHGDVRKVKRCSRHAKLETLLGRRQPPR